jgi:hypothetical protein
MRSFTAAFTQDDGTAGEVRVTGKDIRAWEAAYEQAWYATDTSDTQLAQVVALAAIRAGLWNGTVDGFVAGNEDAYQVGAGSGPT